MKETPAPTLMDSDRDITLEEVASYRHLLTPRSAPRVCPLCGTLALQVRGLRRVGFFQVSSKEAEFVAPPLQVEWGCQQCGYVVGFTAQRFQPGALSTNAPAPLLAPPQARRPPDVVHTEGGVSGAVATFIVSFVSWLLLTWSTGRNDLLLGLAVSALVAGFTYRLSGLTVGAWFFSPRRWAAFLELAVLVLWQLLVQNISLVYRTFHPRLQINPGIVAVPIRLRSDLAITVLSNVMSLTPDTVTLDFDTDAGVMYVHWIDVQTQEPRRARELLSANLENLIERWLL